MKRKWIVPLMITLILLMLGIVLCGNRIIFNQMIFLPFNVVENGKVYHPGLFNDPVITDVRSIQSVGSVPNDESNYPEDMRTGITSLPATWDPPVVTRNLSVSCNLNEEDFDEAEDLKLYLFKNEIINLLNIKDAILEIKAEVHPEYDFVEFYSLFPEDMEAGSYIFVITDGVKIDSVFEYEIVGSDEKSHLDQMYVAKPVIYLYPEETTECYVSLDFEGTITCTYPYYDEEYGWHITAAPDGTLTDTVTGRQYDYLFWEGESVELNGFDNAICVRGCDTARFLEGYLEACGLTYSEIDDFISYWLPQMESNEYNLISFPAREYEEMASLNVSPEPDTVIRVYMVFTPLDEEVEIPEEQQLEWPVRTDRTGFTVVEWGGSMI